MSDCGSGTDEKLMKKQKLLSESVTITVDGRDSDNNWSLHFGMNVYKIV